MKILQAIIKFLKWVKLYLWDKPVSTPPKQQPLRTMAVDVAKDYIVITYHGQRINLTRAIEYPAWKLSSRKDKRITMLRFAKFERDGLVKFVEVDGQLICVNNLDYQRRAEKAKEAK
ncbi:MAG: hypothetical protein JJE45_00145 [Prolixibacteraceae bacterium]|nr:hypothetical protein [Prolixibacteraceae bacterium]